MENCSLQVQHKDGDADVVGSRDEDGIDGCKALIFMACNFGCLSFVIDGCHFKPC